MTTSSGSSAQGNPQQQVIDRAGTDPAFRAQLLENPKSAISETLGIPLPESVAIRVIEEQPGEVVLVLPSQSMRAGAELPDENLEEVAGGSGCHEQTFCAMLSWG
jgi:hypothetical protein